MSLYVDIKKSYKNFRLSVKLETGEEILALLGASGSGKSLTLKCIAGIEKPDSGQIILNGIPVFDSAKGINLPPRKRRIGFLFQNYSLFPNMSVRDNIGCVTKKSKEEKDTFINGLLQSMHLESIANAFPRQISGGQQQRAALARILATEPEIFLLDEPFSALDSHLRWSLEQELSYILKKEGKSAVFVSHDYNEAYRVCDKAAVIHQGYITDISEKHDVFHHPQTLPAARITGFKNISPATKTGGFSVNVLDWGINLVTEQHVPDSVKYVAVRSHSLQLGANLSDEINQFACRIEQIIEEPLKRQLMLSFCHLNSAKRVFLETVFHHNSKIGEMISVYIPPGSIALLT